MAESALAGATPATQPVERLDALIIGAGFSGMYQLHSLRDRLGGLVGRGGRLQRGSRACEASDRLFARFRWGGHGFLRSSPARPRKVLRAPTGV